MARENSRQLEVLMVPALLRRGLPIAVGTLFLLACGQSSEVPPPPPPSPPPLVVVVNSLAVDVANAQTLASIPSAGTDAGQPVVLWYPPAGMARDGIPAAPYGVTYVSVGYSGFGVPTDDFLNHLLLQIRTVDGATLGADFGASFGDLTGTTYWGPKATWPSNPQNAAWIAFWRDLDTMIAGRLGMAGLNDDFWATFSPGPLGHVSIDFQDSAQQFSLTATDQLGHSRPMGGLGDIGAIER